MHSGADLYGSGRSLLRLSSRLVRDGHAVLAVLPYDGALRAELEHNGASVTIHRNLPIVERHKMRRRLGLIKLLLSMPISVISLLRLAARFRPDIIHTNTAVVLSSGIAARIAGVPHVWHIREFFVDFPGLWQRYQWFMHRFSDVIICVSAAVAEQFDPRIRETRVTVVHNGFPKGEFGTSPEAVAAFRQRFGIEGCPAVGVVGRIKLGRKGQETFVRAAACLQEAFPQARFLLIGSPFSGNEDHLDRLMALVQELGLQGKVIYTGDVDDVKAAYAALDISVLPSGQPEPFGGTVIESMAMGLPIVGTRHGGTVEQIEDGVTGFLVEPNNPEELAAALARLLGDAELRRRMGECGRERFLCLFEFGPFYDKMLSIYARVKDARHA